MLMFATIVLHLFEAMAVASGIGIVGKWLAPNSWLFRTHDSS
jgi:hypothetical protein